ncbi:hypothetical protein [Fulvivirga ligni]|uniref:hypothetical protein n=1 Tax=Fulvivirga ligni TaxID=2904246 RepID=UPI001F47135F|nr:hypothetical protein [Fulvivirga ligni]UII24003.1 hypothetical protein LVD16_12315 [Fulvivirga ligni]
MIRSKILFVILLMLVGGTTFSQELTEQEQKAFDMLANLSYELGSSFGKEEKLYFKGEAYDAPWKAKLEPLESYVEVLNQIKANAQLETNIGKYGTYLNFRSDVATSKPHFDEVFRLFLAKESVTKATGEDVSLNSRRRSDVRSQGDGIYASIIYQVKPDLTEEESLKGSITLKGKVGDEFKTTLVTKGDVGKEFTAEGVKYKVIKIHHNLVVLEPLSEPEEDILDIRYEHVNAKGEKLVKMSKQEIEAATGVKDDGPMKMSFTKSVMPREIYNAFQEKPNLTLEEYKSTFKGMILNKVREALGNSNSEEKWSDLYIILHLNAPLDQLYFYETVYKKEVDITLDVK